MSESTQHAPLEPGSEIGGSYQLLEQIGAGGMGIVWRAKHLRLPKEVAIKVLLGALLDAENRARFRREAEIVAQLRHRHIVEVLDFNTLDDGSPYMVLELLTGESLFRRQSREPLDDESIFTLIAQVSAALQVAHRRRVVHRDLKPENIFLVTEEDDGLQAKILDFGISKMRGKGELRLTAGDRLVGTPQYMAPEQIVRKGRELDGRADQFSLGVVAYELLAGRAPFDGDNVPAVLQQVLFDEPESLRVLRPDLPQNVSDAINRALAKEPDQRFESAAAFCREFLRHTQGLRPLTTDEELVGRSTPQGMTTGEGPGQAVRPTASSPAFAATVDSSQNIVAPVGLERDAVDETPAKGRRPWWPTLLVLVALGGVVLVVAWIGARRAAPPQEAIDTAGGKPPLRAASQAREPASPPSVVPAQEQAAQGNTQGTTGSSTPPSIASPAAISPHGQTPQKTARRGVTRHPSASGSQAARKKKGWRKKRPGGNPAAQTTPSHRGPRATGTRAAHGASTDRGRTPLSRATASKKPVSSTKVTASPAALAEPPVASAEPPVASAKPPKTGSEKRKQGEGKHAHASKTAPPKAQPPQGHKESRPKKDVARKTSPKPKKTQPAKTAPKKEKKRDVEIPAGF